MNHKSESVASKEIQVSNGHIGQVNKNFQRKIVIFFSHLNICPFFSICLGRSKEESH